MLFAVKNRTGNFDFQNQPSDFKVLLAIENRYFFCSASETPNGDFVVPVPDDIFNDFPFYLYANGRKVLENAFNGRVQLSEEKDYKNRRFITYTDEQIQRRLEVAKWLALNIWLPEMLTTKVISGSIYDLHLEKMNEITDPEEMIKYIKSNFYFDL